MYSCGLSSMKYSATGLLVGLVIILQCRLCVLGSMQVRLASLYGRLLARLVLMLFGWLGLLGSLLVRLAIILQGGVVILQLRGFILDML